MSKQILSAKTPGSRAVTMTLEEGVLTVRDFGLDEQGWAIEKGARRTSMPFARAAFLLLSFQDEGTPSPSRDEEDDGA